MVEINTSKGLIGITDITTTKLPITIIMMTVNFRENRKVITIETIIKETKDRTQ